MARSDGWRAPHRIERRDSMQRNAAAPIAGIVASPLFHFASGALLATLLILFAAAHVAAFSQTRNWGLTLPLEKVPRFTHWQWEYRCAWSDLGGVMRERVCLSDHPRPPIAPE